MKRLTQIVATIGPASRTPEILGRLVEEGLDVARLNFSHGSAGDHREAARAVREAAARAGRRVRILADLQGPKLRIGELPEPAELPTGSRVLLAGEGAGNGRLPVPDARLLAALVPGDRVFLDDGAVELEVAAREGDGAIRCEVRFGGRVDSRSGLIVRGREIDVPPLSERDLEDIAVARALGADAFAQSMVRGAADVRVLRGRLGPAAPIVAKIETAGALNELEEIASSARGFMVARGDLGVSIPRAEVPLRQKEILALCRSRGRFGIVATEMLLSMVRETRPTRAEVSDVATAIFDGADAVMLSEETAIGEHPALAVREMREIIEAVEASPWFSRREAPAGL